MTQIQNYVNAASALIGRLQAPPQVHSVWVRTDTDSETGEFVRSVRVAIHPEWMDRVAVPREIDGKTVVQVDWETLEPLPGAIDG